MHYHSQEISVRTGNARGIGGGRITADWLREAWGFEKAEWSKIAYENGHGSMVKVNDDCWHYEDDNFEWPHDLHTRQQFCDLAKALGIPRKDGAK